MRKRKVLLEEMTTLPKKEGLFAVEADRKNSSPPIKISSNKKKMLPELLGNLTRSRGRLLVRGRFFNSLGGRGSIPIQRDPKFKLSFNEEDSKFRGNQGRRNNIPSYSKRFNRKKEELVFVRGRSSRRPEDQLREYVESYLPKRAESGARAMHVRGKGIIEVGLRSLSTRKDTTSRKIACRGERGFGDRRTSIREEAYCIGGRPAVVVAKTRLSRRRASCSLGRKGRLIGRNAFRSSS